MANCLSLYTLPTEVVLKIVEKLEPKDLSIIRTVDSCLRFMADDLIHKITINPINKYGDNLSSSKYSRKLLTYEKVQDIKLICKRTIYYDDLLALMTPLADNITSFSVKYDLQGLERLSKKNVLIKKSFEHIFTLISSKQKLEKLKIVAKDKSFENCGIHNLVFTQSIKTLELVNIANSDTAQNVALLPNLKSLSIKRVYGHYVIRLLSQKVFLELRSLYLIDIRLPIRLMRELVNIATNLPNLHTYFYEGDPIDLANFIPISTLCNKLESLTIKTIYDPSNEIFRIFIESVKNLKNLVVESIFELNIDDESLAPLEDCLQLESLYLGSSIKYPLKNCSKAVILKDCPYITEKSLVKFLKNFQNKFQLQTLILENTGVNFNVLSKDIRISTLKNMIVKNSLPILDQNSLKFFTYYRNLTILSIDLVELSDVDLLVLGQTSPSLNRLSFHSIDNLKVGNTGIENLLKFTKDLMSLEFNRANNIDVGVLSIIAIYGKKLRYFSACWTNNLIKNDLRLKQFIMTNKILRLLGTPSHLTEETELLLKKFLNKKNLLFKTMGEKPFTKFSALTVDFAVLEKEEQNIMNNIISKK